MREAGAVASAYEDYSHRVKIIGIGGRGSIEEMKTFISGTGVDALTHVADEENDIWRLYGVTSQPTFAFIDDTGAVDVTRISIDDLRARIETLVSS